MDEPDMNAESRQPGAPGTRTALHRLATYGSLVPGRINDHQLDGLKGRWLEGYVQAKLIEAGWGASLGFPAMVLDPGGPAVHVHVFESADPPAHWSRLDDFEGPCYQRVVTTVHTPAGEINACICVLRAQDQDHGSCRVVR